MKYCVLKKVYLKPKPLAERNTTQSSPSQSSDNSLNTTQHSAMELEAAAALLMLRYQYDIQSAAKLAAAAANATNEAAAAANATIEATSTATTTTTIETAIPAESSRSPTPPPPCVVDNCTPKEQQVRVTASSQPLKKRTIPSHLLRRSLTPAKQQQVPSNKNISQNAIVKAKIKAKTPLPAFERNNESSNNTTCNKALLKSCRNMIREFLDNQEKI
ncbi:uncharacterized protein LOC6641915 [Drosophila willistoni]|uniref:uncharacterized protein LOC6641915 n=1 Tax=Drosophila willistoni TaxID=7260 RepID=UPI00017D7560|nr:uncharacterized protein LOC6641915 [Drosophila willistoni]